MEFVSLAAILNLEVRPGTKINLVSDSRKAIGGSDCPLSHIIRDTSGSEEFLVPTLYQLTVKFKMATKEKKFQVLQVFDFSIKNKSSIPR